MNNLLTTSLFSLLFSAFLCGSKKEKLSVFSILTSKTFEPGIMTTARTPFFRGISKWKTV
jgi:hypothetical protein